MATPHSNDLVERTGQWLFERIMEERDVFYNNQGVHVPEWEDLPELDHRWWTEHAQDMLTDLKIPY